MIRICEIATCPASTELFFECGRIREKFGNAGSYVGWGVGDDIEPNTSHASEWMIKRAITLCSGAKIVRSGDVQITECFEIVAG